MLLVAASRTVAFLVFEKYEILQVLGQGSMGYVAAVRVRSGKVAGSATDPKKRRGFNIFRKKASNPKAIEETSEHTYALKTIQIDRVSTLFIEELENEVGCDDNWRALFIIIRKMHDCGGPVDI
jgi:hypothetical protein